MNNVKNTNAARALAMGVVAALVLVGTAMGAEKIYDFTDNINNAKVFDSQGNLAIKTSIVFANDAYTGFKPREGWGVSSGDTKFPFFAGYYTNSRDGTTKKSIYVHPSSERSIIGEYSLYDEYNTLDGYYTKAKSVQMPSGCGNGVNFKIKLIDESKNPEILLDKTVSSSDIEIWQSFSLDISKYKGQDVKIQFIVDSLGEYGCDGIMWGEPKLIGYSNPLPQLALTKSLSPSTITEGDSTTVTLRVENTGGDAKNVKITDTIPQGFTLVSGSASQEYATLKATETRTFQYTIKATGTGRFVSDLATVTYKDEKGNSYSGASNSATITVQAGTGVQAPQQQAPTAAQPKTPGFGAILAGIGIILALAFRRR